MSRPYGTRVVSVAGTEKYELLRAAKDRGLQSFLAGPPLNFCKRCSCLLAVLFPFADSHFVPLLPNFPIPCLGWLVRYLAFRTHELLGRELVERLGIPTPCVMHIIRPDDRRGAGMVGSLVTSHSRRLARCGHRKVNFVGINTMMVPVLHFLFSEPWPPPP